MTLFHNYDVILSIQTPLEVPQSEKYLNAKVSDEIKDLLRPCSHKLKFVFFEKKKKKLSTRIKPFPVRTIFFTD